MFCVSYYFYVVYAAEIKSDLHCRVPHHTCLQAKMGDDTCTVRYLMVIDFEATCEGFCDSPDYQHEIIEFPAVIIDAVEMQVILSVELEGKCLT